MSCAGGRSGSRQEQQRRVAAAQEGGAVVRVGVSVGAAGGTQLLQQSATEEGAGERASPTPYRFSPSDICAVHRAALVSIHHALIWRMRQGHHGGRR